MEKFVLEDLIMLLGTFGLLLAFMWLVLRKKPKHRADHHLAETSSTVSNLPAESPSVAKNTASDTQSKSPEKSSWWAALAKTRSRFSWASNLEISELKSAIEEACIVCDMGVQNTNEAIEALPWDELKNVSDEKRELAAKLALSKTLGSWLEASHNAQKNEQTSSNNWPTPKTGQPTVIWFVGVNGVGKTTSIAKFAHELVGKGHSVLLAAGDTFRAAASEQLETWAKRLDVPCVRGAAGADSSAVLFDAIQSAQAKKIDFVLCDSAGRLHNHAQLMDALSKNQRVMNKALEGAPHETLLVLDAHTGQNMLAQAKQFQADIGLTGLILTKLDGSARGGAVVAVSRQTGLPIRRLGLGEKETDFVKFEAAAFIKALLGLDDKVKVNSQEPVQSL